MQQSGTARFRLAVFLGLASVFLLAVSLQAEPPYPRTDLDGVNVPRGVATDTYVIYRDFRIPVRYYDDKEFPGYVKVIDADNVLWVAKRGDLGRLFEKILPKELDRVLKEANGFFDTFRIEPALREYQIVLVLMPKNPFLHLRIAQCYAMLNKPEEAKRYLKSALALAPDNPQALNELGLIAFSEGDYSEALALFTKAYQRSRKAEVYEHNLGEAYLALADQMLASGRYKEAINQIENVMALLPEYSDKALPPKEESIFRRHLEVSHEARILEKAPKKTEDELWVEAGRKLIHGRLWREAIALFRTLYEEKPGNRVFKDYLISSFLNRGDELFAEQRWEEAIATYLDAKHYIPTEQLLNQAMFKFLIKKGKESYEKKNWLQSIKHLDRIYQIFPENQEVAHLLSESHYHLAQDYAKDFRFPEALESAGEAYKIKKDRKFAVLMGDMHVEMGVMALHSGKWLPALMQFEQAYKIDPTNLRARRYYYETRIRKFFAEKFWIATLSFLLATILLIAAVLATSKFLLKKQRARLAALAEKSFGAGDWSTALAHYDALRRIAGKTLSITVLERIARCYSELGEYNNAILNYTKAEEILGGEKRYLIERCKIFALKGNAELTMQYLREAPDLLAASQTLMDYTKELIRNERDHNHRDRLREVLGGIHLARGERSTAKAVFEELHGDNFRSRYPLRKLIEIAKLENEPQTLKTLLEKYLEIDPMNAAVIFDLGEYFESIGRKKEALDRYAESYEISPLEKVRERIRHVAKEFTKHLTSSEAETVSFSVAQTETIREVVNILLEVEDYEAALEILQQMVSSGISDPWVTRNLGDCFCELEIDDMAIKYYRRFLDQAQRDREGITPSEDEKLVRYNLARVYERKGLTDLALKEFQAIYEHDMRFKDIALKIPVLYEKQMQDEQLTAEKDESVRMSQNVARPSAGQIRCPKCLNIISNEVVYCPFCTCKVGFTESELEEQASKRKARIESDNPMLPAGSAPEES